jgi:hypothetical protein
LLAILLTHLTYQPTPQTQFVKDFVKEEMENKKQKNITKVDK